MDTTKIVEKIKYGNVELKLKTENLQEKTVDPSTEVQTILPDHEYGGMSAVIINAVTSDIDANIISENIKDGVVILGVEGSLGELEDELLITENGIYDVRNYASANVNVPTPDLSQTTATAEDVREGKEFYNASGEKVAGTYKDMLQLKCDTTKSLDYEFFRRSSNNDDAIYEILSRLDTSQVTSTKYMLAPTDSGAVSGGVTKVPLFDTSNVTDGSYMFYSNWLLEELPLFDFSSLTNGSYMFAYCNSLSEIPLFDFSRLINAAYMFAHCKSLTTIPLFNTSNVSLAQSMFYDCVALETIPLIDLSKVSDFTNFFRGCSALKTIPALDLSAMTNAQRMFYNCTSLTTIPALNTTKLKSAQDMFYGCSNLTTIESLDLRAFTSTIGAIFQNCTNLTNLTLKNIKRTITIGSGTTYGHLLTLDSLLNTIKELWTNTGGTKTLTMGTANTAKLADVYVKLIDITDDMRAEDEYIDNKAPFVQCESTDEGAMLITEYVTTVKKWQLA